MVNGRVSRFRARLRWRLVLPGGRVARYAAPAAFLLAVTAVVLVVRSTLQSNGKPASATTSAALVVTTKAAPATRRPAPAPRRYYVIQSGDTLDAIASRFATTVDALVRLNPDVKPTALTPGERVRIK